MSRHSIRIVLTVLILTSILLAGCQPIQPDGSNAQTDAWFEQMKAEALQHELGTFRIYINRDLATLETETGPEFFSVGADGSIGDRDAYMTAIADEKLTVRAPDLGEIRVWMIAPNAYMVTYPLNFNGSYDGTDFSNPRTVSSLWVKRNGKWQNIFLHETVREGPLAKAGN